MMRRRDVLKAGVGAAGAVVLGARVGRADDPVAEADMSSLMKKAGAFFAAPVEATALGEGLHLVTGPGGNIAALAGPDGLIMVDSGLPNRAKDLQDAMPKLGGGRPVAVLVNTHWHFDHSGGNAAFGKDGAKIWATPATRRRLSTDQFNEAFQMKSPAAPREGLPVLTFDEAEAACGDETIHMVAVPPAHTDGDLVIHFRKANVIHAGDLFNNGFYPNIDASSRGWIGGMIAGADRVLAMAGPKTRIIPGHGPLATVDDLKAFRAMLVTVHDRLARLADAKTPLDDALRARPTADLDANWAKGLFNGPQFTKIAYDGLLKHRAESGK
jgi:glyoxylase-like metal-dependent hydrolase (beta-lactamase superfamily II)